MESIWKVFECLDEMVYVADIDTNEICYMNAHLRNSLGYQSHDEYAGKKCYEILQGRNSPCPFCTNSELEPAKFVSWIHHNPILHKSFLIKDSMICYQNHKYRMELAIDMDVKNISEKSLYYAQSERILGECLRIIASAVSPDDSINQMLAYIGAVYMCDRSYIFEINDNNLISNTYEWCANNILPQKDIFQKKSLESIDWWFKMFKEDNLVFIRNLEDIRNEHPMTYAILKSQNISSIAVAPISVGKKIRGFIGIDNPNYALFSSISSFLKGIGVVAFSLLSRKEIMERLENISFRDQLTGAFNRNALFEHHAKQSSINSIGVIFCDITGLKRTNDSMGHEAGDQIIKHCYQLIRETLESEQVYRVGGDEFVVVFYNMNKADFCKEIYKLRKRIKEETYHIAIGYHWTDQQPLNLESSISKADKIMYQDKQEYYDRNRGISGIDRRDSAIRKK